MLRIAYSTRLLVVGAVVVLVFVLALVGQSVVSPTTIDQPPPPIRTIVTANSLMATTSSPGRVLFTGDIMLGRDVERRNRRDGMGTSLAVLQAFSEYDAIVINLEAPIPDQHVPTPDFGMRFSIHRDFAPLLAAAGVTHVGLANNHTLDHGPAGYNATRMTLKEYGLKPFGHPTSIDEVLSLATFTVGDHEVAVLGVHVLFTPLDIGAVTELITSLPVDTLVVAYIHWGEEYQLRHSAAQRRQAEALVTSGVDIIIGHHPHVTQGIEMIDGVPVVYSLGNIIFDQYFSNDVQVGLLLSMVLDGDTRALELIPITSIGSPTIPRLMDEAEREIFLADVARRSETGIRADIQSGRITW